MKSVTHIGFEYTIEVINKDGEVTDREVVHNLMPIEGMNHLLAVLLLGASQNASWHIGLYDTPYTPVAGDVAATFPTLAGEATGYVNSQRMLFEGASPVGGTLDNAANPAEFEFTAENEIHGGFISSSAAKGSTSGVLLSAVRFTTPKSVEPTSILRVTAGFALVSM